MYPSVNNPLLETKVNPLTFCAGEFSHSEGNGETLPHINILYFAQGIYEIDEPSEL